MSSSKRLDYLNIEPLIPKGGGTTDHISFTCFHPDKDNYKHTFHAQTGREGSWSSLVHQLNFLADQVRQLLNNTEAERENNNSFFSNFFNLYQKVKHKLSEVETLTQQIASSNTKSYLNKLLTREEIESLISRIDQQPKDIERETVHIVQSLRSEVEQINQENRLLRREIKSLEDHIQSLDKHIISVDLRLSKFFT